MVTGADLAAALKGSRSADLGSDPGGGLEGVGRGGDLPQALAGALWWPPRGDPGA